MPAASPVTRSPTPDRLRRLAIVMVVLGTGYLGWQGYELRRWAWEWTRPIRFTADVSRGWRYGRRAYLEGSLDLYDLMKVETRGKYQELDYAPGRLWIMELWAAVTARSRDLPGRWQEAYEFTAPALHVNVVMEALAAVGVFLLTRHWLRRPQPDSGAAAAPRAPPGRAAFTNDRGRHPATTYAVLPDTDQQRAVRGWLVPFGAALLVWFNPAVILNAHAWPQWDVWIVPFFVWALYLACRRWWLVSGLVLALGAMCKGQQLIVAPFFVLWPLLMGRPGAALRWLAGLALGIALVASVWMVTWPPDAARLENVAKVTANIRPDGGGGFTARQVERRHIPPVRDPAAAVLNRQALQWVVAVALGYALLALRRWRGRLAWYWWALPALLCAAWVAAAWWAAGPFAGADSGGEFLQAHRLGLGVLWVLVVTGLAWALPRRWQGAGWALCVAGALWLCVPMYHASLAWLHVGWGYGTHHWQVMIMGPSDNIPGLLMERFGWDREKGLLATALTIPAHFLRYWPGHDLPIDYRHLFMGVYLLLLALCSWGAAWFDRAGDRRFLVAAIGPWVMMFLVLAQMHDRYLLFAAAASACWLAVSWRWVVLHLWLTLMAFKMPLHVLLRGAEGKNWNPADATMIAPQTVGQWLHWCDATHPDMAWALLIGAGLILVTVLSRPVKPALLPRT